MYNWRKPVISLLLKATGSRIPYNLNNIKKIAHKSAAEVNNIKRANLKKLLFEAYKNVPFYNKALAGTGVIDNKGEVDLDHFSKIPILTKDIIKKEYENLKYRNLVELEKRKYYVNTSGGSTGEPVKFIQDKEYKEGDIAATLFMFLLAGKDIGEKELKLWGSERDIFEGSETLQDRLKNKLYNRLLLNSFRMRESDIEKYIIKWNAFKPKIVWTYIDSIYEFAKYVEKKSIEIYSPQAIIVTAGTVYDWMKEYIEKIIGTKVLNQYGSREVGVIASECSNQHGLHVFEWKHHVEILDADGNNCETGQEGEIVVTSLENLSMPFIRFRIGDRGIWGDCDFKCGYHLKVLKKVTGRVTDHFVLKDGTLIHGEYFTHLFYFHPWIKKFQVVQKNYELVEVFIVKDGEENKDEVADISNKIKLVMGNVCRVNFKYVDDIQPLKSGKFLFTVSELDKVKR